MSYFTAPGFRGYFNSPLFDFLGFLIMLSGVIFAALVLYIGFTKVIHGKDKAYWPPYTEVLIVAICIAGFVYHLSRY